MLKTLHEIDARREGAGQGPAPRRGRVAEVRGAARALVAAVGLALAVVAGAGGPAVAQQAPAVSAGPSLGQVRADLDVLNRQIAELRSALVAAGPGKGLPTASATALTRLDQLEAELRRLTNRVEVLTNDVSRIVTDATNRAGDIEFRLTELEGGDVSALGKPEPLGGGVTPPEPAPPPPAAAPAGGGELAVSEQGDFDAAVAAAQAGDNARAAALFEAFVAAYPGGPLTSEAQFRRGEALAATGDQRGAARAFLDAFSGAPEGPTASKALLRLAGALGALGQTNEACLTLGEVTARYPGSEAAGQVPAQKQVLACP
ncbi:MAG: tol-pal system protein YbgF [Amaricoccus sp.]|nr:tol-pal system protein YbgF [Amaricoccus sp.]